MNMEITGRHVEITPSLRKFVEQHLEKIQRLLGDNLGVHVILAVEKKRHQCEIVLTSKTGQLTCLEETADMYTSVTRAAHKLEKQALKTRSRRTEVKRRRTVSSRRKPAAAPARRAAIPSVIEESIQMKPMAIEEALMSLEESAGGFVVYRDVESKRVSVVYRRKDGNIGLIHS